MFDIGFSEILLIAVVALIVIGPERLPGVARTLGHLFGRMQRYVNDVKADIQREMDLEELRKLRQDVEDSARSIEESARAMESSFTQEVNAAKEELRSLETLGDRTTEGTAQAAEPPGAETPAALPPAPGAAAPSTPPPAASPASRTAAPAAAAEKSTP